MRGDQAFTTGLDGAIYRTSAACRYVFSKDPAVYAPRHGGLCASGTATGRKFDGDLRAWTVRAANSIGI